MRSSSDNAINAASGSSGEIGDGRLADAGATCGAGGIWRVGAVAAGDVGKGCCGSARGD
jgi:hypothetical protein